MKNRNENLTVLTQASSKVNALINGDSPEDMNAALFGSLEETRLVESVNTLIKSFLVLDNYVVPMTNGVHDKYQPDVRDHPDFPSEMIHPRMMEVINLANDGARSNNLKDMVCQMAIKEKSLNEAVDDLAQSRKALLRECLEPAYE